MSLIQSTDTEKLLRPKDVARILNISRSLAYRLMKERKIRTIKIAGTRRVEANDLESYIRANKTS